VHKLRLDEELYRECMADELANVRYLQADVMFLTWLKEQAKVNCPDDWELEEIISCLIFDENQLIQISKEKWHEAKAITARLENL
jgi:hypothetical protein